MPSAVWYSVGFGTGVVVLVIIGLTHLVRRRRRRSRSSSSVSLSHYRDGTPATRTRATTTTTTTTPATTDATDRFSNNRGLLGTSYNAWSLGNDHSNTATSAISKNADLKHPQQQDSERVKRLTKEDPPSYHEVEANKDSYSAPSLPPPYPGKDC